MSNDRPESSRPDEPDHGLDVDAAFAEIVSHWEPSDATTWPDPDEDGDEAAASDSTDDSTDDLEADRTADRSGDDGLQRLFTPAFTYEQDVDEAPGDPEDEGHFVPPPPPPLPTLDPRRKVAWICLVGTPALALVLLVAGVVLPQWMAVGLVLTFVAGFGYLVATMGSSPPDDWSGSDGAVL